MLAGQLNMDAPYIDARYNPSVKHEKVENETQKNPGDDIQFKMLVGRFV